jgi:hypothetical protein
MQTDLTPSLQGIIASDWSAARVALGIVSDRELTRLALATVLSIYPEITVLGVDSGIDPNSELLAHDDLKLLVVNLPLEYINGRSPGLDFVRFVKQVRADVRVLLLKRRAEEQQIRASRGGRRWMLLPRGPGRTVSSRHQGCLDWGWLARPGNRRHDPAW